MHPDFKDLLSEFNAKHVEFLIVGAHALAAHGIVRATKDMDVWVRPTLENAERVADALAAFGAPLHGTSVDDFTSADFVLQIGVAPIRIDILTSITGVSFEEAWRPRLQTVFAGEPVSVLSKQHLIQNKTAAARPQDLIDVGLLTKK